MLIIDSHLDLGWNALQWNRDLREDVYTMRVQECSMAGKGRGTNTVSLPELRRARVGLCFATFLARSTSRPVEHVDFRSVAQAYAAAQGQYAYYRHLEREGWMRIIRTRAELDEHWAACEAWDAAGAEPSDAPPLGVVLAMEGADPILEPEMLQEWRDLGLRFLGLSHYGPCRYAGGTDTSAGLTDLGRRMLPEMARLGVTLDMTHTTDAAFWEALDIYDGPIHASHHNCRALAPHQRQLDDAQIKAIVDRDGVIGAALDVWMMVPGYIKDVTPTTGIHLEIIADHIDHVCQIAGSANHAAIGSDLDGGFGLEQSPCDFQTIADMQRIAGFMQKRGYTDADIANIMHGNWLRFLRRVLPAG